MAESLQETSDDVDLTNNFSLSRKHSQGSQANEPDLSHIGADDLSDLEFQVYTPPPEELEQSFRSVIQVNLVRKSLKTASGANTNPDSLLEAAVTPHPGVGDDPPAILVDNIEKLSDREVASLLLRLRNEAPSWLDKPRHTKPAFTGFEPLTRPSFIAPQQLATSVEDDFAILLMNFYNIQFLLPRTS